MIGKKTIVHVVPHSHWDREWYFTLDDSNVLLAENLDGLLDVLEGDPEFPVYVFDGQASIAEDYLRLRPHNANRFQALVAAGRILIGPWYTQTDSLIVDRECIIRNLLTGTRMCSGLGYSMKIGYLPDAFGQNSYLPSFFTEFGIHDCIVQRGLYDDQVAAGLNFRWQSPDGRSVRANNIFFGYGPGKFIEPSMEYLQGHLVPILNTLRERSKHVEHLVLPSGGDQVYVRAHVPHTVAWLNENDPVYEYRMSSYEQFMAAAWEGLEHPPELSGELLACQRSRIHNTVRSQRQDIKSANHRVESAVIRGLEPLSSIGWALGLRYPSEWLDEVWRALFNSQAHDSMGGCNSDVTNSEIIFRLGRAERIVQGLENIAEKQIARAVAAEVGQDIALAFNLLPTPRTLSVRAVLFSRDPDVSLKTLDGQPLPTVQLSSDHVPGGRRVVVTAAGSLEENVPGYYRTELLATVAMPALGYTTYRVSEGESSSEELTDTQAPEIDNGIYRVAVRGGRLAISDARTGRRVDNAWKFEGVADAGDSYDFSPLPGDTPVWGELARLVSAEHSSLYSRMTVEHDLPVAEDLQARTAGNISRSLTITTVLELLTGDDVIRVTHSVDNDVRDHRIRVVHPVSAERTYADQGFGLLTRPKDNPYLEGWREAGFAEAPVPIYPIANWVVAGEDVRVGLITRGLREYQLTDEGIAVTLFRSVGLLGRDDLQWRPGRASGINNAVVRTPDAQLQGHLEFSYGLRFSDARDVGADWAVATDRYLGSHLTYQLQTLDSLGDRLERFELPQPIAAAPAEFSAAEVVGSVHVSAVKLAEDGDGVVVRVFNPSGTRQPFSVRSTVWVGARTVTLAETPADTVAELSPQSYATVKLA